MHDRPEWLDLFGLWLYLAPSFGHPGRDFCCPRWSENDQLLTTKTRPFKAILRHIISVLLQNEAGALARLSGLFAARGYNIESLAVAPTSDESVSRLTLVTEGTDDVIGQINKQLGKLVDVVDLADMTLGEHIERELLLVKVRAKGDEARQAVRDLGARSHARILDDTVTTYSLQLAGTTEEVDALLDELTASTEILETVRSGVVGIQRGEQSLEFKH